MAANKFAAPGIGPANSFAGSTILLKKDLNLMR
jgi:hypothetical protein